MKKYEMMCILTPNLEEDELKKTSEKIYGTISKLEGKIEKIEKQGRKKLAYPINKFREGYYLLIKFEMSPDKINELERMSNITEGIIRHLITRHEE